jgi:hypothetical protein
MIDLQKYKADVARARDAGITFEAVRDIMNDHIREDDDGTSFGRMVEQIRELALQAADRMAAEKDRRERTTVVAWLREWQGTMDDRITHEDVDYAVSAVERGEHHQRDPGTLASIDAILSAGWRGDNAR